MAVHQTVGYINIRKRDDFENSPPPLSSQQAHCVIGVDAQSRWMDWAD